MINESTVKIGGKYRVIRLPDNLRGYNNVETLLNQCGICRWTNYRGVCLKFPNGNGYVIPFDCLIEESGNNSKKNSQFRNVPVRDEIKIGYERYRVTKAPDGFNQLLGKVGQLCTVIWTDRADNYDIVCIRFNGTDETVAPLDCIEDVGLDF